MEQRRYQDKILGITAPATPTLSRNAGVVAAWFKEVRLPSNDPAARLFVNESGIENNPAHFDLREEQFDHDFLTALVSAGAPVDGIRFESHFRLRGHPPATLQTIFDRFAGNTTVSGNPLVEEVTEYDNAFFDPYMQADYLTDYLTMVYSEPTFDQFCFWGFWGGDFPSKAKVNGVAYGNLFDANLNLVPAGEACEALVFKMVDEHRGGGQRLGRGYGQRVPRPLRAVRQQRRDQKSYYADLPTIAGATVNIKLGGSTGSYHVWLYEAENAEAVYPPLKTFSDDPTP